MEDVITQSEVMQYIELTKLKYDLTIKKIYAETNEKGTDPSLTSSVVLRLKKVSQEFESLLTKFKRVGFRIVLLLESELNDLTKDINNLEKDEILVGLTKKSGRAYELLFKRNSIIKQNIERKEDVAKTNILINLLSNSEREALESALSAGKLIESIKLMCDHNKCNKLTIFLNRLNIGVTLRDGVLDGTEDVVSKEIRVVIANKATWVPEVIANKVRTNVELINTLSVKLQVLNAKRQVEIFSEKQELDFVAMQEEYLKLLKEQDSLLKDVSKDEELVYKSLTT